MHCVFVTRNLQSKEGDCLLSAHLDDYHVLRSVLQSREMGIFLLGMSVLKIKQHEFHETSHSLTFIVLVNSHQR